jgi:D-alanyl-D-alanine carboxypeptidase
MAALWVAGALGLAACTHRPPKHATIDELVPALEDLVRRTAAAESRAPAVWLHVQAPRLPLRWQGGAGPAANPAGPPAPSLRIASNTKTFVAAAVLRLAEDDALDLDTPLVRLSAPATVATLRAAGYDVDRLTPLMLLQHTAGLRDYATLQVFLDRVTAAPAHRWTRTEQLQLAMDEGPPLTPPGAAFHYSDTGYILLGELIETVTGQSMPRALAGLLAYRRLGIKHTWFETLEPEPAGAPARTLQLFDEVDAARFDPSIDLFGGGGLVSNLDELAHFYRAVVRGEIFARPSTAATMLAVSPQSLAGGGPGYGMGIARLEHAGVVCHGHGGFWGTDVWHCPAIDVTVAAAVTSTRSLMALRAMTMQAIGLAAQASQPASERTVKDRRRGHGAHRVIFTTWFARPSSAVKH